MLREMYVSVREMEARTGVTSRRRALIFPDLWYNSYIYEVMVQKQCPPQRSRRC